MKLSVLSEKLGLKVLTDGDLSEREVSGCYIGDLLSWVMGRASSGDVWITIMNNINIVAVASLTDCACILLCEGVCYWAPTMWGNRPTYRIGDEHQDLIGSYFAMQGDGFS
jgi:hypothetical protein